MALYRHLGWHRRRLLLTSKSVVFAVAGLAALSLSGDFISDRGTGESSVILKRLLCESPETRAPRVGSISRGSYEKNSAIAYSRRMLCETHSWADDTFPPTDNPQGIADFGTSPPGGEDNIAYVVTVTSCPEAAQPAAAASDDPGSDAFFDAAAILKHGVCNCTSENPGSGSSYNYTMYAIVHPDAVNCLTPSSSSGGRRLEAPTYYNRVTMLQDAGYWVKIYDPPVSVEDIPDGNGHLKSNIENDSGLKDLMKLHAYRLTNHPLAVVMSFDAIMTMPMDDIFNSLKADSAKGAMYSTYTEGATTGGVDTDIMVIKPSEAEFGSIVDTFKNTLYDPSTGWGGSGDGTFAGGMGTKGLLKYYYSQVKGSAAAEEFDLKATGKVDTFEPSCGKPWQCKYDDNWDAATKAKCEKQNSKWYQYRYDFEQHWNKPSFSDLTASNYHRESFLGYCSADGESGGYPDILRQASTLAPVPTPVGPPKTGNAWVDAHNERRFKYHTQFGAVYAPVAWDAQLATQAQNYADWLMAQDGTCFGKLQEHGHDENAYGGENLMGNSGSSSPPSADYVLTSWAENEESYVGGHFLGVIWRATQYIGCAQASEGTCHFTACRYVRPGNCNTGGVDDNGRIALAMADSSPCGPFEPGSWSPTPSPVIPPPTTSAPTPTSYSTGGCNGEDPTRYDICLDTKKTGTYTDDWTQDLWSAKAKWESVVIGDLPGVFNLASLSSDYNCGAAPPTVDDIYICAKDPRIDGISGIIGSAGPTAAGYVNGKWMPVAGRMEFDSDDIQNMISTNRWSEVVKHEMGHILGIGSLWDQPAWGHDLVPSSAPYTYKTGTKACEKWREITGCTVGSAYECPPIEDDGGAGTAGGHWDETVLTSELMTGWVGTGDSALSAITVGCLEDMGYTVDYGAADPYTLSCPTARRVRALAAKDGDGEWQREGEANQRKLSDAGKAAATQYAQMKLDEATAAKPEQEAALVHANEGKGIMFIANTFVSVFFIEDDILFSVDMHNTESSMVLE